MPASARATMSSAALRFLLLLLCGSCECALLGRLLPRRRVVDYTTVNIAAPSPGPPAQQITVVDLMPAITERIAKSGLRDGSVLVVSRHTTTAVTINEWESRLVRDLRDWLLRLAPPDERSAIGEPGNGVRYLHNDIDQRPESEDERRRCRENGWEIDDPTELQRWRDQEPINAHSHLAAILLGSSECVCAQLSPLLV